MEVINQFKDGLAKYRKQDWEKARAAFGEALKAHAGDKLSKIISSVVIISKKVPLGRSGTGFGS
jgi:hypothetical protein